MAPPKELGGIMVAVITPWTDDQTQIDAQRLKEHIDRLVAAGVHGIVPGGSTGEFTAMTQAERKQLIELCVEYAAGRISVVAGTGALTTRECLELAKHASDTGANALMVVPPYYDAVTYEQLEQMMVEIGKAANIPLMYYNIPSATGLKLTPEQIAGLSKSGVKYLKDTSGDGPALTELLFERQNEITAFNGWDTLTFYGLAAGAKGSVWGASNIIPELSVQLWDAVAVNGDLKKGRELWSVIFPICKFLEANQYHAAVKTGMELLGHKTGGIRKPFTLLPENSRKEFAGLLTAAGLKVVA
ncbi:hypothetical protein PMZ80_011228 [Knufia obscura]|nr:hypothetical protein PMZ80_011228 [Knufia obscura]